MWLICLLLSVSCVLFAGGGYALKNRREKNKANLLYAMMGGVFAATFILHIPVHAGVVEDSVLGAVSTVFLCLFSAVRVFSGGLKFSSVQSSMGTCPEEITAWYELWTAVILVLALFLTVGFLLSFFKNLSSYLKYMGMYNRDVYVFSSLNDKSLALASDIKARHKKAAIVFTGVAQGSKPGAADPSEEAGKIGGVCFKKDITQVNFKKHSDKAELFFFTIGEDETRNVNQALKLIEDYRSVQNTHLYVFSKKLESELLLTAVDKGAIKVRRVNEVQSLINRILYERGQVVFESARPAPDGRKHICAAVVGMGNHGTEMVKALAWFGQMDGYSLAIHAFDKDPLAEEKFTVMAPELMDEAYNGVQVDGEAQYKITVHPGIDVQGLSFVNRITQLTDTTYIFVALGNDDVNIRTAVSLRMYFERMGLHPVIQAVVYNSKQKNALLGVKNYRGQPYDIQFLGDTASSYAEDVILDSELEEQALQRHLKWGEEADFWTYEYNYRSSVASAIHMRARVLCGIPGADKKEEALTDEERDIIERLEHRRWNAYMRSEGYVYSGSKDKSSRNDLAKMHHDLVDFASLSEEEKRKDSKVGTI